VNRRPGRKPHWERPLVWLYTPRKVGLSRAPLPKHTHGQLDDTLATRPVTDGERIQATRDAWEAFFLSGHPVAELVNRLPFLSNA
jgi:hypothetical protein